MSGSADDSIIITSSVSVTEDEATADLELADGRSKEWYRGLRTFFKLEVSPTANDVLMDFSFKCSISFL